MTDTFIPLSSTPPSIFAGMHECEAERRLHVCVSEAILGFCWFCLRVKQTLLSGAERFSIRFPDFLFLEQDDYKKCTSLPPPGSKDTGEV